MILDPFATVKEYRNTKTYLTELNREIPLCLNEKHLSSSSRSLREKTQLLFISVSYHSYIECTSEERIPSDYCRHACQNSKTEFSDQIL